MAQESVQKRVRRSIIIYSALGILVIGLIVSLVSIIPLYGRLKEGVESRLGHAVKLRTVAVEEYLSRAKDIALQITSRTQIRRKLEAYNRGEAALDDLVKYTHDKLADAMNLSEEVVGISRLGPKGELLVEVGMSFPERDLWPIPPDQSNDAVFRGPIPIGKESFLMVGAHIFGSEPVQAGTDIILFRIDSLRRIVGDYTGLGKTGETLLGILKDDAVSLFFPLRESDDRAARDFARVSPIGSAIEKSFLKQAGMIISDDSTGKPVIIAYGPVYGAEWGIAVKMDAGELYSPVNRQVVLISSVLVVLIFLGTFGIVLMLRPLTDALDRELTERKRAEAQLLHDAFHDPLTDLPNRALFMDHLELSRKRAKRRKDYLFAVLFLDLDRFKVVNDSLGHMVGDQLLIEIGRRLETCMRPGDTVARLGGDEFTILLDDIEDVSDATRVAERIHSDLALPLNVGGQEIFTTASIGIALSSTGYDRPEDLLRDADIAMHRAKALGKARHEVFDTAMHTRLVALLQLETDLRQAVERREFVIYYQPIVSLESGRMTGFEALVRWQPADRGLVSPAEFIPLAEETGLVIPIGEWVLQEACRQMHAWQMQFPASSPLSISVNLSGKQFMRPELVGQIQEILHKTGLDAGSLKLEITESVIMENAESVAAMLLELRALNVQLYIDDFGTGYCSLGSLYSFPIDTLKIGRYFVSQMGVGGENVEIIRTIVTLAHNLDMVVIAEGVETAEQLAQLRALKCEYAQGYFFSKPVNSEAAGALIAAKPKW